MKPGVMLVNTSRGALDTYEEVADLFFENLSEVIIQDDTFARLLTFPNVLVTGHQGVFTREALGASPPVRERPISTEATEIRDGFDLPRFTKNLVPEVVTSFYLSGRVGMSTPRGPT